FSLVLWYFGCLKTVRSIDKGQNQGITVQQAAKEYTFTTKLQFKNLKPEELGTLLIVLRQDPKHPIALKLGGGKPIGMGTMTVEVTAARVLQNQGDLRDRYSSYKPPESDSMNGTALQQFMQKIIQAAHSSLVKANPLQQLAEVLKYPIDREPKDGMY
ncbi:CRISPR-associated protein, partial [Microcoleus sp. herbarium14]